MSDVRIVSGVPTGRSAARSALLTGGQEVAGRIVGTVLVSTIFGVAGGALGAFAVGEPVVREAAQVAVGSLVTGVGVVTADEIWSRLRQRGLEPPGASSLTLR